MSVLRETVDVPPLGSQMTLRDVFLFVWRGRWISLLSATVCATLALALAEILPPKYVATVTLMPAESGNSAMGTGGLLSMASNFSGIAPLAGLHLDGESGLTTDAITTLRSRLLINEYIQQHNLLPVLFSSKWDSIRHAWKISDPKDAPTLWDADRLFQRQVMKVHVTARGSERGVITLTIVWKDPILATQWANGLVELTNAYLRQKSLDEARRDIAYLSQEVSTVNIVAVKNTIYSLMEAEIKKEMIAKGRKEFALRIIDPASTPKQPSSPKPLLWTIGGAVGGGFLGLLIAVLREALRDEDAAQVAVSGERKIGPEPSMTKAESVTTDV